MAARSVAAFRSVKRLSGLGLARTCRQVSPLIYTKASVIINTIVSFTQAIRDAKKC